MSRLSRELARMRVIARSTPPVPAPEHHAARRALRRLSVAELEVLESALVAQEVGESLSEGQHAAMAAWDRVIEEGGAI
jgi:hypothetical protein